MFALLFQTACSAQTPTTSPQQTTDNDHPSTAPVEDVNTGPLRAGEYITEKGWGRLLITKRQENLLFSIESVVGEDICSLSGEIKEGHGIADNDSGPSGCAVGFVEKKQSIEVSTSTPTECKRFCGYNGGFEAAYLKVKDGCGRNDVQRTRETFKRLYDSKRYSPAVATLSPMLTDCLPTLEWEEEGDIRNDLAIAQYKNALYDQCLITLEKYVADAKKDDNAVVDGWTPALADRYLSIVKAARTNIALCSKKPMKK